MNCLQNRLETFRTWVHKSPDAAALADAGFYYTGDPLDDDDTVTCFCCNKELSGWDAGDDPLNEHLAHPKTKAGCAWALLMNEKRNPTIPPDHSTLLKARELSFKGWPHEKERGWVGKAKKMAKAGFHFAPSAESPDAAECIYCKLSLDGWERTDDPRTEHEKRAKDLACSFFEGLTRTGAASSIFALTKNAFATGKVDQEPGSEPKDKDSQADVQEQAENPFSDNKPVKKRQAAKRKLPIGKDKKRPVLEEHTDDERLVAEPIPIILKSARKKRGDANGSNMLDDDVYESPTEPTTVIKKPRFCKTRSDSINSPAYTDRSVSPDMDRAPRATTSRARKGRTPLADVSNALLNTELGSATISRSIKEEPIEEELVPESELTDACLPDNSKTITGPRQARAKRVSKVPSRRTTRNSSTSGLYTSSSTSNDALLSSLEEEPPSSMAAKASQGHSDSGALESGIEKNFEGASQVAQNVDTRTIVLSSDKTTEFGPQSRPVVRRSSSRLGSANTAEIHLEQILDKPKRARTSTRKSRSTIRQELEAELDEAAEGSTTNRRNSSRRRGSNNTKTAYLEEVIKVERKVKTGPQSILRTESSQAPSDQGLQDSLAEQEERPASSVTVAPGLPTLSEDAELELDNNAIELSSTQNPKVLSEPDLPVSQSSALAKSETHSLASQISLSIQESEPEVIKSSEALAEETALASQRTAPDTIEDEELASIEYMESSLRSDYALDPDETSSACYKNFVSLLQDVKPHYPAVRPTSFTDTELDLTLEEFLRGRAQQHAELLRNQCEKMISTFEQAGQAARESIVACAQ